MTTQKLVILFAPYTKPDNDGFITLPYSLLYLERMLKDLPVDVMIIDEIFDRDYDSLLENNKDRLLVAGVSCLTGKQIERCIIFSEKIRKLQSDATIVWGGWHPSLLPEQTLAEDFIDIVVVGQGELSFRQLVENSISGKGPEGIAGVVFKKNGNIIFNELQSFQDYKHLPPIDLTVIDINRYVYKHAEYERTLSFIATHGCPYRCGFCSCPVVYGQKWYHKSKEDVFSALTYLKETAQIDSVLFWDENFFLNKEYALDICREIIRLELNIKWDAFAHAAHFLRHYKTEDVQIFYEAGLNRIVIGAESGHDETLRILNKKQTSGDLLELARLLKPFDISPVYSLIFFFPENTLEDAEATLEMMRKAKLINHRLMAFFFPYMPFPRTAMYEYACKHGFEAPKNLRGWIHFAPITWHDKKIARRIEHFDKFYVPFANPYLYKVVNKKVRKLAFVLNKILFPIVYLRFRYNFFKFPFEAVCFLFLLKHVNKLLKTRFKTGDHQHEVS